MDLNWIMTGLRTGLRLVGLNWIGPRFKLDWVWIESGLIILVKKRQKNDSAPGSLYRRPGSQFFVPNSMLVMV